MITRLDGTRQRATMKDVAQLAGVSTKTVSRVINGEPNVSERIQTGVWDAVRKLDYHVDMLAGSLRRSGGKSKTLGLLVGHVENPFSATIHRAIEDVARARGVAVFASSLDDDPRREEESVQAFLSRRVDGLILTTASATQSYLSSVSHLGIPAVYVDRIPAHRMVDTVVSENRAGARMATAHLIAHGHSRIALLTDSMSLHTARERHAGYVEALQEAGLPVVESLIVPDVTNEVQAAQEFGRLLSGDEPPTAVFSAQNIVTIGVLRALRERGLQGTIACVGFDDLPLADLLDPAVTVVAQDAYSIGERAAQQVFARIDGDTDEPQHIVIPTTLITRGSGEIRPSQGSEDSTATAVMTSLST